MATEFFVQLVYHYSETGTGTVVARLPGRVSVIGQIVAPNRYHLPGVPTDSEIDVEIQRPHGEILLRTRLKLGKTGASRFVWGKPKMMDFVGVKAKSPTHITLQANLYAPQEVILCSGRHGDDGNHPMMANFCNRRMQGLTNGVTNLNDGIVSVNDSCVFTIFEFRGQQSRVHHLLRGSGGPASNLPGNGAFGAGVKMGDFSLPAGTDHLRITDVYDYMTECGRTRPGTVVSLEFMSHGSLGGPSLENSWRRPTLDQNDPQYWVQRSSVCTDECAIDIPHGVDRFPTPSYFRMLVYNIDYDDRTAYLDTDGMAVVSIRPFEPGYSQPGRSGMPRVEHRSRANFEVFSSYESRLPEDADPRSTDFLFMASGYLDDLRNALHADCIIRTWGCMWGDEGPRLARFSATQYTGPDRARLDIRSDYYIQHSKFNLSQRWIVRRKDAWLHFLSLARRTYAQAIATFLQRPCYSALPGNWAETTPSPRLLGMQIPTELRGSIQALAHGVLGSEYRIDEAGYVRYYPAPARRRVTLSVLVTGFRPFSGETVNASQEAVRGLSQTVIQGMIHVPSWIDLDLQLHTINDVDVVWTCDASVDPGPGSATHVRGGAGIVDFIQKMPNGGPDIVLAVGETQRQLQVPNPVTHQLPLDPPGPEWIRLEAYAHNSGVTTVTDNDSQTLVTNTPAGGTAPDTVPIFSGQPDYLETSIPRLSYLQATERLYHHPAMRPPGHLPRVEKFDFPVADGNTPRSLRRPPIPASADPIRQAHIAMENARREGTPVGPAGNFICNETYYQLLLESQVGYEAKRRVGGNLATTARYPASGRWVLFAHVYNHRHPIAYSALTGALAATVASICEDMLWSVIMHGRQAPIRVSPGKPVLEGKNGLPTS